jgi:hypothetical protein
MAIANEFGRIGRYLEVGIFSILVRGRRSEASLTRSFRHRREPTKSHRFERMKKRKTTKARKRTRKTSRVLPVF